MRNKKKYFFILGFFLLFAFSGCSTGKKYGVVLDQGAVLENRPYQIRNINFDVVLNTDIDIDGINAMISDFRVTLEEKLKNQNLLSESSNPKSTYMLDITMLQYDPGSALERWGSNNMSGESVAVVKVEVFDNMTNQRVGRIQSKSEITCCGLYSVGGDDRVIRKAAKKVAKLLIDRKVIDRSEAHHFVQHQPAGQMPGDYALTPEEEKELAERFAARKKVVVDYNAPPRPVPEGAHVVSDFQSEAKSV